MSDAIHLTHVVEISAEILADKGAAACELGSGTRVADAGLDSLDLATLVVRMEERVGRDPFSSGEVTEFPRTFGELAALYAG